MDKPSPDDIKKMLAYIKDSNAEFIESLNETDPRRIQDAADGMANFLTTTTLISEAFFILLTATSIEQVLRHLLISKMRKDLSNNAQSTLFDGYGPLGSFSARIDLAFALDIISDDERSNCRAIKDIRNDFAHSAEMKPLKDPDVLKHDRKLKNYRADVEPIFVVLACAADFITAHYPKHPFLRNILTTLNAWASVKL
jgi:DNA-binding MltR family transcriptional regulator